MIKLTEALKRGEVEALKDHVNSLQDLHLVAPQSKNSMEPHADLIDDLNGINSHVKD
jgi:hypothetical protein